jgi:hypothetical protein
MLISVAEVLVRPEIAETRFVCNVDKCKGACCTFESKFGAPLKREEIGKIDGLLDVIEKYLPLNNIEVIESKGFYEEIDGELLIRSVENKECVFVYYEDDIARCGIEKAYNNDKTDFKKPISCHLFPIRISDFGGDVLRFEKIDECKPALEKGVEENITIAEFCEEPLQRYFGKQWYSELKKEIGK